MKIFKKSIFFTSVLFLVISLVACNQNNSAQTNSETNSVTEGTLPVNQISTLKTDFTYKVMNETDKEDGINIIYPQLYKASNNEKSDSINKAIQMDIRLYLESLKKNAADSGKLTLDMKYQLAGYSNKVLSIEYTGVSSIKDAAYPTNVYHTQNIDLDSIDNLSLKSLFKVDINFVNAFKSGMYSPYSEDLDLEKSNVDIKGTISDEYSDSDLLNLFQSDNVNYKMTEQGVIISVDVPHAVGDHLEMAINYESIEANLIKENPIWKDYLFLSDDDLNTNNDFSYKVYANPRFGFQLSFPDIFTKSTESDNGDGTTMESKDGLYTLKIWGSNNIDNSTGKSLLASAKDRVSDISGENAEDNFYSIDYEGGDSNPILFHECGFILGDTIIGYVISYPASEKDKFASVIDHMTKELKGIKVTQQAN